MPRTAEGTLGIYVKDFFFEREVEEVDSGKNLTSSVKVADPSVTQNKTQHSTVQGLKGNQSGLSDKQTSNKTGSGAASFDGKQKAVVNSSAPSKINAKGIENKVKPLVDNPKKHLIVKEISAEKVHIPDSFDDFDAESETLSDKIRKLEGYGDVGQSSFKKGEDRDDHQVMFMRDINAEANMELVVQHQLLKQFNKDQDINITTVTDGGMPSQESGDVLPMEDIINSQESTITVADSVGEKKPAEASKEDISAGDNGKKKKPVQMEMRRSERLKREIHVTTQEKMEAMAKKRCMEGNSKKRTVLNAVDDVQLQCLARDMGVIVPVDDYATINLIKDIEAARHNWYVKHNKTNNDDNESVSQENMEINKSNLI